MTAIKAFVKSHPLLTFYALAFAISWGGVLMVVGGPGGIPGTPEQFETLFTFVLLAMLVGPSVAGLLLTGLVHGRAGFRELALPDTQVAGGRSLVRGGALYRPALVDGGTPCALANLPSSSPAYSPRTTRLPFCCGCRGGLVVGIFEELGWTGFAIPRMRRVTVSSLPGSSWGCCGERGTSLRTTSGQPTFPPEGFPWPSSCP